MFVRLKATAVLLLGTSLMAIAHPAFAQRGGSGGGGTSGGGSSPTDYLPGLNKVIFSVPETPTTLTKNWMNAALVAMGNPQKLANIRRTEFVCEMAGTFGGLVLEVAASSDGAFFWKQIHSAPVKGPPERTMTLQLSADSRGARAGNDDDAEIAVELSEDVTKILRRSSDLWNPVLTTLGQFGTVEKVDSVMLGSRACTRLTMGSPRLQGLTSGLLYLDAVTSLPVAVETNVVRDIPISGQYTITEWQTVSGINVPRTLLVTGPDGTCTLTFHQVKLYGPSGEL